MKDTLELSPDCWMESYDDGGISLCYIEHATDHWMIDSETSIDIYIDMAEKIIDWLQERMNAGKCPTCDEEEK